jgi:uncharacterized protein YegJ (DUF2314 family)
MMLRAGRILPALATAVLCLTATAQAQITEVSPQNKAVNEAIEVAKSQLPVFFQRLANPRPGDSGFLVKIRYEKTPADGGSEHIWAKDVVRVGDSVSATIDNDPRHIANLQRGQRVTVPISQLTDWLYVRDGKYVGAYTVRALLPFMPTEQAADMRERLAPQ